MYRLNSKEAESASTITFNQAFIKPRKRKSTLTNIKVNLIYHF